DLSDLDFTAGLFTGTNFSDANLTNTIFRSARLDHATFFGNTTILAGTDFTDAILLCTDLSGNDLSTATFDNDPIITKDFSCRLDLSGTTLPINALPFASWRYINFTGATLLNGAGTTISTLADPVDLSGALLSGVTGLSGAILDGADLGCATPAETVKNCTELIDIVLSDASLIQANLAEAAMNGANLIQANLEMADLSGAQLLKSPTKFDSAKLDGAFLKNANLAEA
ncbi:MAG: pentapeptide repeat-containing protein, partial [bacterium]|nr:pentapeptide repeat-containing protein [bacterium]